MLRFRRLPVYFPTSLAAVLTALQPAPVLGLDQWRVDAVNRAQFEYYQVSGNPNAAPYPFENGQVFDQFTVDANRRLSPYERINLRFSALGNDSRYRSEEQGFVLERARFFWEKGDGAIPVRVEAGDIYAYHSVRTLQTGLKGLQTELQPTVGSVRHSLQFFAGQQAATYNDSDSDQPLYLGGSWLIDHDSLGNLAFNVSSAQVHGYGALAGLERDQQIYALAHALPFSWLGQSLTLEAEWAHLRGDANTVDTERRRDNGVYLALSGRGNERRLSYQTSYEEYGRHYRPFGAGVVADQRSIENYLTWRFASGRYLRGRYLYYRDGLDTANPVDTHTAGTTLGGRLFALGSYETFGNVDVFVTERDNRDNSVQRRNSTLNARLSTRLSSAVTGRLDLLGQISDDRTPGGAEQHIHQGGLAIDYDVLLGGMRATVSPGLLVREINGDYREASEWRPQLRLSLHGRGHALRLSYNSLHQDNETPIADDTLTQRTALQYDYSWAQHRVGVELNYYDRDPDHNTNTYASRAVLYWEYRFDKPVQFNAPSQPSATSGAPLTLARFAPGTAVDGVTRALRQQGLGQPSRQDRLLVYETQLLPSIPQRQRLVYAVEGGRIDSAQLLIDFDAIGDGRSAGRVFDQVLGLLIQRHGSPDLQIEDGDFGPALGARLSTGEFKRVYQWRHNGRLLRFGVPARNDGLVRMELRYADTLPPAAQNDWSLTRAR